MESMIDTVCDSTTHLLSLLGIDDCHAYQEEFISMLNEHPDLLDEDWSSEPELLEVFYCYIRKRRPHTIVEIGTYKGKAAFVMAKAQEKNSYGELFTIDNDEAGFSSNASARLSSLSGPNRVTIIESSSAQAFTSWIRAKIDLLFIDASHDYLNAVSDISLWARHLSSTRGLMVVHDTVFRLERCFPKDYVYPLSFYDIIHVTGMKNMPSLHEWKGAGFLTVRQTKQ